MPSVRRLLTGKELIEANAYQGLRSVIDLSADSANNWNGPSIPDARDEVLAAGITINGLTRCCAGAAVANQSAMILKRPSGT